MDKINHIIYGVNEIETLIFGIISGISGVLTVVSFCSNKNDNKREIRRTKKEKWGKIKIGRWFFLIFIISIISAVCELYSQGLAEVPDVIDDTYDVACIKLGERDLKYTWNPSPENLVITEQYPKAGTIVARGTKVKLEWKLVGSDYEIIENFHNNLKELGVSFFTFKIFCKEDAIRVYDTDKEEVDIYMGNNIEKPVVETLILCNEDEHIYYYDYEIVGNSIVFHEIPEGYSYSLEIKLKGYQKSKKVYILNYSGTYDGMWGTAEYFVPENEEARFNTRPFILVDEEGIALKEVEYGFSYDNENEILYNIYITDENGDTGNIVFQVADKQALYVCIRDPYKLGNNASYSCQIEVNPIVFNTVSDYPVIKVYRDGHCEVIPVAEFMGWDD